MTEQQEQPWTVLKLLEWTTEYFKKRGSPSARLDAEVLLAHARDCSRISLYTSFAEVPTDEQRVAFREMVRRRGEGMPVAQLVGHREFYSLKFRVDDHVLIPRPETEHVVIAALDFAKSLHDRPSPLRIIDVGTGSGAIAVSIAKHCPQCTVLAVDVSAKALEIAKWNVEHLGVASQVRLIKSNLFDDVDSDETFDIIVSNPPYIRESEYAELSPTVRDYEPKLALVSGPAGTEIIEPLVHQAAKRIAPGGLVLIELSPMIADACVAIAEASGHWKSIELLKDLAGHRRVLSLRPAA